MKGAPFTRPPTSHCTRCPVVLPAEVAGCRRPPLTCRRSHANSIANLYATALIRRRRGECQRRSVLQRTCWRVIFHQSCTLIRLASLDVGPPHRRLPQNTAPTAAAAENQRLTSLELGSVQSFFSARCYASTVLAMALCPSVCLSVTSRSSTKTAKRRITQITHTIAQGLQFSDAKDLCEIRPGSPLSGGGANAGGVCQNRQLSTNNRLYLENGTIQTHGF